jgi:hypothetical protein
LPSGSHVAVAGDLFENSAEREMFRELQVDTSELKKLKGISIGMTDDDRAFLVFTYKKGKLSERIFALLCWSVVAALYGACGFVIWWWVAR